MNQIARRPRQILASRWATVLIIVHHQESIPILVLAAKLVCNMEIVRLDSIVTVTEQAMDYAGVTKEELYCENL